jgi:hypothetical protein
MSTTDRLLLILHIGFAIFTLGPITAATMASPRYIRRGDISIVRYLNRGTRIYGLAALGIFLFGIFLAKGKFDKVWLSASMTLFIVAVVLLLIVERDQRKALHKLELAVAEAHNVPAATEVPAETPSVPAAGQEAAATEGDAPAQSPVTESAQPEPVQAEPVASALAEADPAEVETGRIATISGVVAAIWLVILILMVWH